MVFFHKWSQILEMLISDIFTIDQQTNKILSWKQKADLSVQQGYPFGNHPAAIFTILITFSIFFFRKPH